MGTKISQFNVESLRKQDARGAKDTHRKRTLVNLDWAIFAVSLTLTSLTDLHLLCRQQPVFRNFILTKTEDVTKETVLTEPFQDQVLALFVLLHLKLQQVG